MHPDQFAAAFRAQADEVYAATGIDPEVSLAQWGVETDWGNVLVGNNLGNIRCSPTTFCQYTSLDEFCQNAAALWHSKLYINANYPNGFEPFRAAAAAATSGEAACVAIGQSPWDSGHYDDGAGPGSALVNAYELIGGLVTPQEFEALLSGSPIFQRLANRIDQVFEGAGPNTGHGWTSGENILKAVANVPAGAPGPAGPPGPAGTVPRHDHVVPANTTAPAP